MKKVILLVICIIAVLMANSVFAATTLSDVKNTKYEDSVNMLITLDTTFYIISGIIIGCLVCIIIAYIVLLHKYRKLLDKCYHKIEKYRKCKWKIQQKISHWD